jgi:hypothetical protein
VEKTMPTSIRNAKRSNSIRDTAAERWSRLYVDVRASYGRASIQSALLLNDGASVVLLAFLGNLAIAHETSGLTGNFVTFKDAFLCFGIGVILAASSSVVAFPIQNVAIAHIKEAEGKTVAGLEWLASEWLSRRWSHSRSESRSQRTRWAI